MSYLKRLTNAALGRLQAFRMYGGIGMSASSLHRESTDSLIGLVGLLFYTTASYQSMNAPFPCLYLSLHG